MKWRMNTPASIDEALEEAGRLGFSHRLYLRGKKVVDPEKRKEYALNDIAVVSSIVIRLDVVRKGILNYTVSCDGELGVVIDKSKKHRLARMLSEKR
jgi:hypothetical protein